MEWGNYDSATAVEWIFTSYGDHATYLSVTNYSFEGDGDRVINQALDLKGGFTWVLAGTKVFLEHGIGLNLITDAFPKGLRDH